MRTLKLLLLLLLCTTSYVRSQDVAQLMAEGKSYAEIQQIMRQRIARNITQRTTKQEAKRNARVKKQYLRWEHFWKNSLMPNGDFPNAKVLMSTWKQQQHQANKRTTVTSRWSYFGPKDLPASDVGYYPGMGRVNAIAIHPTNHNLLFAGGAGSGVWKSTDNGKTWVPKTDNLPNVGISDIVFDPNNPNIVYAASGDADGARSPFSIGLFKSTDLGETWSVVGLGTTIDKEFSIRRIAMPKIPANTLLVTTTKGIQKSTDGGANWTKVADVRGFCIFAEPGSNTTFYAGTSDAQIYKSTDTGATWKNISPKSPMLSGRIELGLTANDLNFIVAMGQQGKLAKSTDGGATWSEMNAPQLNSQGGYNMTIAISPKNKNTILLGAMEGWRTKDGGANWEKYLDGYWEKGKPYFYVHSDHHMMRFKPDGSNVVYVANDGGVFYGDMTQATVFTDISKGLFITQYYGIGLLKTDDKVLVGGAQDNDGIYINASGAKGLIPGSDGIDGMIDYSNPDISYVSNQNGTTLRTTDGWKTSVTLDMPGYQTSFSVPMAMHPTKPATIFFAGNTLIKSTNRGDSWSTLYTSEGSLIDEIALAPSDGDIIVISSADGMQRTTDGGKKWTVLGSLGVSGAVTGIAIHPTTPNVMYVSVAGFKAGKKVFKSSDAGKTWINISFDLPNVPLNDIVTITGTNETLYVATDLGVYYNSAGAKNWTFFNTQMPHTKIYELEVHYQSKTLFAATYGRGIWRSPIEIAGVTPTPTGVTAAKLAPRMKAYPTVNNGRFVLDVPELKGNETYELFVFNAIGGVVLHKNMSNPKEKISLNDAVNGIYFVTLRKGNAFETRRIIVARR